jgi:hypothetical protein
MLRSEVSFIVPSLHYWEFCNVLRAYVRRGEIELKLAQEIYELHLDAPLVTAERSTTPWVVKLGKSVRPLDALAS